MMSEKILVVDDSASDRFIIKNMLKEYNVVTACDGLEALQRIDEHKDINLVILDLNMPNMDGFQVLTEFNKNQERYKRLRAIILTNHDEMDNEIKGLKLGAVDYIRKPINMDSLIARIDIHMQLIKVQNLYEQKLCEQGLTFDTIFNQAPIGIAISKNIEQFETNKKGYTSINPMFEKITGRSLEEIIDLGWENITHPDDLEADIYNFSRFRSGEVKSYSMEKRYIKPDGSIVWIDMIVAPLKISDDNRSSNICLVQDITRRKTIEADLLETERSKEVLLYHLPGLAYRCKYDEYWTMLFVSEGCFELTGYSPESLTNNKCLSYNDIIAPEYHKSLRKEWDTVLAQRLPFKYEYEIVTAQKEKKWVMEMGQGIYNQEGEVEALEGIILDISERKEIEDNLKYNNEHDTWTGLFNLRYLEKLLKKDSNSKIEDNRAVVSINLSAMHLLSMTYGFHYTQDLTKKIADALKVYSTEKNVLFNIYENLFVFYLKDYGYKSELTEFCESIAKTLGSLLKAEGIGGGIGIVEINQDNEHDVGQILKSLLIASERAIDFFDRDFGICYYDSEFEKEIMREEEIKRELTQISTGEKDGLFLEYQPIIDLKTNQIYAFEALARLKTDKLGLVPPLEFIPIAEKTKLIVPIGYKLIYQAFSFLNNLKAKGYDRVEVSINISSIQLLREDFNKNLIDIMNKMQINPENIIIEITESIFADNYNQINKILGELRKIGIKIAIDDFGTGYSSLARERELNVNCLKIDKSFIDKLVVLNEDKAITGDIISMAHKLGHFVVAEGVENENQRKYLMDYGCDKIQGYLISKPIDEGAANKLLEKMNTQK